MIITADERMKKGSNTKGIIFGEHGIGKTRLATTLDPDTTLFVDIEAGTKVIKNWGGTVYESQHLRDWLSLVNLGCWIGGVNPAMRPDQFFSQAHYDQVCKQLGDPKQLDKFDTIFVDSITVASRHCFQWCLGQPEAISEKTGKPDTRGAYGLLGRSMLAWLTHIQHTPNKNIWLVGALDQIKDDYNRISWVPQIEGGKLKNEIHGIVDEVYTLTSLKNEDGQRYHVLVTDKLNQWGYPAKSRSGLQPIEEAHLGNLMKKANSVNGVAVKMTAEPVNSIREGE